MGEDEIIVKKRGLCRSEGGRGTVEKVVLDKGRSCRTTGGRGAS